MQHTTPLAPHLGRALPVHRPPLEPQRPTPRPAPWGHTYIPSDTDPVPAPWTWDLPPPAPPPPQLPASPPPQLPAPRPEHSAQPLLPPAWPDARTDEHSVRPAPRGPDRPRRLGRSLYDAEEARGCFGLVDTGDVVAGSRVLVAHVPRRSRGYQLDLRPGDQIRANSARGDHAVGGRLDVAFVTRHQYFAPGRSVTSCILGVPDAQWRAVFGR
jgi:hypothetical protein